MKVERTKNATRNLLFGSINKIILLLFPFVIRTLIIKYLGIEYVGLGSLFNSILNVLSIAELGISSAIVFSMYGAIAEDNKEKICALLSLYKKVYRIIGLIVLGAGLCILPFLKFLIKGSVPDGINIYLLYLVYLLNTSISYFLFAFKTSLFIAHQRYDVVSKVSSFVFIAQYLVQVLVLIFIKNYYVYVVFIPVTTILNNIIVAFLSKRHYPNYQAEGKLDSGTYSLIKRKVRSLMLYKLGSVVLNSVDAIVISSFLGLEILGRYNNYYFIITTLFGFLNVYYNSINAGIGNSLNTESYDKNKSDFDRLFFVQGWIIGWCTICLLCLYQAFIQLWVGENLLLPIGLVFCFAIYFFVWKMMDVVNLYKDAAGLWEHDKFRPLIASAFNLTINIILVNYIGLYGIVISTILSIMIIIMPWSTIIVFKYLFNKNLKHDITIYFLKWIYILFVTIISGAVTYFIADLIVGVSWLSLLLKALICVFVPNILFFALFCFNQKNLDYIKWLFLKVKILSRRRKK